MWRKHGTVAALGVASVLAFHGCLTDVGEQPGDDGEEQDGLGQVGLALTLPDGSEVTTVGYVITRDGAVVDQGDIAVGADGHATKTISGLPVGSGYHVALTASRPSGAACAGAADFAVVVDTTTSVSIVLSCEDLGSDTGSVSIDGSFNVCPKVTSTSVSPTSAEVGQTIGITANARDLDGDALSFAWTATSGTFAPANALSTTYTCTAVGSQVLTLSVSDGPESNCSTTATVNVDCVAPASYSSQSSYLVPVASGVLTRPIFTVGDSANLKPDGVTPYRMVGLPDGMGAFDNGDGTFTLLANHEAGNTAGIARAHGGTGAFVSRWIIRKSDLGVLHGEDLIQSVQLWTPSGYVTGTNVSLGRFCSADLPAVSAFYDAASGLGTQERLFLNGEETGNEGRGFAHAMNGVSYELPRLGKFSWENSVASPLASPTTVVVGTDDSTPGQVYVYVGTKTNSGSVVERAGLTNGTLYGVAVPGFPSEPSATGIPAGPFTLASFGDVTNTTGAALDTASTAAGVTRFNRPEDGAWDPAHPNDFYFVTTNSFTAPSRLWRLRFTDATQPQLGGTIEAVLDGSEGQRMFDNLGIDGRGHIVIQEDPGNQDHLAQTWRYDIASDTLTSIAQGDPARFAPGASGFLTRDEEHSGAIDATELFGAGWWLVNTQAHYGISGELIEGGQLQALYDPGSL